MYIVQIKKETETWIAAICQIEEDAAAYLKTLSEEIQAAAFLFQVPIEYYPFILIQNRELPHHSDSYFEYCNFETLQTRIDRERKNRSDLEEHIYFTYYYISEPYGQIVSDENLMHYLSYTSVTNHILNQPYPVSLFHEEVKKNASRYDIDRLDQLFEHTKTTFTSALEKEDLALNGYDSLFWEMNYDHACGKLTEAGMSCLLPMVDKIEILLNEKKWQHRSFALHILLEQACKEKSQTAVSILEETLQAFDQYLISNPEEKLEIHRLLSLAYRWMIEVSPSEALKYWQLAAAEIYKAIDFSPEQGSWSALFELTYMTPANNEIDSKQKELQKELELKTEALEKTLGTAIAYPLALAYQHVGEFIEWHNIATTFPDTLALRWAEKALAYNPEQTTRIDLHEAAQFFNEMGAKMSRVDFLFKTISIYERIMKNSSDCAMEVYYIGNLWKQIAEIHLHNKEHALADTSINNALELYQKHIELVKSNRSSHMHYAEFLEYCYSFNGNINKPSLAELKRIANEIEIESEGFYSAPYVLLMRIALFEHNEKEAIMQCTKSLILHELCVDSTFDSLLKEVEHSDFNALKSFLNETKAFMEEVTNNYYYDPRVKWKTLRTMSDEELTAYWEVRKEEIRNRPPHIHE